MREGIDNAVARPTAVPSSLNMLSEEGHDRPLSLSDKQVNGPEDHSDLRRAENASDEVEETVLSDAKLVILATGMFIMWACNAGSICQTAFLLPAIAEDLHVSPSQVQWVSLSCMIAWGSFQVIAGRLDDVYGRRKGLFVGSGVFIVSGFLTAFMPNLASVNVCRAFTGLGAALMLPASSGIVAAMFPAGRKRTLAYVVVAAGGAGGAMIGQLFAGIFLRYTRWSWRPAYLMNAVVSLYAPSIVFWLVPVDIPHSRSKKMDWIGSALLGTSLFLLLFGFTISQTNDRGWKAPYLPALFLGFALLFSVFILRQRQLHRAARAGLDRSPPLIPASLLTKSCWNLLIIDIAAFCAWAAIDTIITPIAYLYFDVLNLDRFEAGLKITVSGLSGVVGAILVALTIRRVPARALLALTCGLTALTPVLFAIREIDWPFYCADLWALSLMGLATDSINAAGLTIISNVAPVEDVSVAAGLFQTSCRLGYPVGLAIATLVRSTVEKRALSDGEDARSALIQGLRGSFWVCTGFMVICVSSIGIGMRGWEKLGTAPDTHDATEIFVPNPGLRARDDSSEPVAKL